MTRVSAAPAGALSGRRVPAALLALTLALTLGACGGAEKTATPRVNTLPSASPSEQAAPVEVTGLSDPTALEVGDGEPGISPGGGLTFVSPVYDLGPDGDLGRTVTVRIELDNALPEGSTVLAGTRAGDKSPWTWIPAELTSDLRHAEFETDHFSQYGVLSLDTGTVLSTYKQTVQAALVSGIAEKAKPPTCVGTKEARRLGFTVTSTKRATLGWCFGLEKDKPVLKVVNRRTVPVQVDHGDAPTTTTASKVGGMWTAWLGVLGPGADSTFLAPGGTATYDVDIASPSTLAVSAETDAVAQSMRALYAGVQAMVAQAQRYGLTTPTAVTVFQGLLARPTCAAALGKGSAQMLSGCLSQERMTRIFGEDTRLLLPLLTAPSLSRFWANRFAFLARQALEVDTQEITVDRAASDFGDLVGAFSGADRSVSVSKKGEVVENFDTAGGRVISLTYVLSRPQVTGTAKTRTTSATALLKKVTVYDKDAIDGNVPKAGSEGTISITRGIVTPPFLATTYCDRPARKKGSCD